MFYITIGKNGTRVKIIAELLRAEVPQAEPHTLENLVAHRSQNSWLSRDCPSIGSRAQVRLNLGET